MIKTERALHNTVVRLMRVILSGSEGSMLLHCTSKKDSSSLTPHTELQ